MFEAFDVNVTFLLSVRWFLQVPPPTPPGALADNVLPSASPGKNHRIQFTMHTVTHTRAHTQTQADYFFQLSNSLSVLHIMSNFKAPSTT